MVTAQHRVVAPHPAGLCGPNGVPADTPGDRPELHPQPHDGSYPDGVRLLVSVVVTPPGRLEATL
jgi:hypothetical protein